MTNTPLSEREKELYEAALLVGAKLSCGALPSDEERKKLDDAVFAYDPKPEPVPVIPAWEEFCKMGHHTEGYMSPLGTMSHYVYFDDGFSVEQRSYERIRTLTSKAPTE